MQSSTLLSLILLVGAPQADAAHAFMPPAAVDARAVIPAPPAPESMVAQAEQELMIRLQELRTPELVAVALRYDTIDVFALLRPVLGEGCSPGVLPRTAALFQRVSDDCQPAIEHAKSGWNRARPYVANPGLEPVVYRPVNTSYPSGHSVLAEVFAVLLNEALPEHGAAWNRESAQVRWSRIIGGAHYPSDTRAGALLGRVLGNKLLESRELRAALREAGDEIRAQQKLSAETSKSTAAS